MLETFRSFEFFSFDIVSDFEFRASSLFFNSIALNFPN
jgi:hypothetical protein